ncbi:MAG: hypothetical protein ACRDF4_01380 [Rhabdochlamydiaceae bacterium]
MSKALKEAGWRLILPEIRQIVKEELQSAMGEISAKFEAVNTRIDSTRNELKADMSRVESKVEDLDKRLTGQIDDVDKRMTTKIDSGNEKLTAKIDDLDKRLDIVQRLAILEAKVREREQK